VQSQCWDMLGCVGDVGILCFFLGAKCNPNVGMCWECWDIMFFLFGH